MLKPAWLLPRAVRFVLASLSGLWILADIKAGKLPAKAVVDSGVDIVTPANLAQYQEAWAKLEKP